MVDARWARTGRCRRPSREGGGQGMPAMATGAETEGLRIQLLGGFRVTVGDRLVPDEAWSLRKAASLLKLLALAPGHRLHRDRDREE